MNEEMIMQEELTEEQQAEQLSELLQIRRDKLKSLQDEGRDPYAEVKFDVTHHAAPIKENFEEMENVDVVIAGRMMSKREMGKASFCDILDKTGRIQAYVKIDEIGIEEYERFKKLDIGDIIGIKGFVFKTRRGENFHPCKGTQASLQVPPSTSRKVARP